MAKMYKGWILYSFENEDEKLEKLRIHHFQNSETVCVVNEDGIKNKVSVGDLTSKYTVLAPDGYISFARVKMNGSNTEDVIVAFHRKDDIDSGKGPYAVCRQAITDVYTNLINRNEYVQYIGCSISEDTCPKDIDFRLCTACDEVVDVDIIAYYLGDTIDTTLGFIKTQLYDEILKVMKKRCNTNVLGCCTSIKELLKQNNFEYDVLRGLDIYPVSFKIELETDDNGVDHLNKECTTKIEDILKLELKTTVVVPYSKEIDMTEIKMDHIIVRDSNFNFYIIGYVGGKRVNHSYDALDDKRDYILMNDLKYSSSKR